MKKVFLHHLRPGFCWEGTKAFFIAHNLIDPDDFRRNGIDAEKLIVTGEPQAIELAKRAVEVGEDGREK